jgi:hypothetical protein
MKRRTLLGVLASAPAAWPQNFPGEHAETLRAIAAVVLPAELGAAGLDKATADFITWVKNYRAGAETDHGYGNTRIRAKGQSPAADYLRQLAALKGQVSPESITAALTEAGVTDLPRAPGIGHVAADLMAFYFRSSDANDLCYRAQIGRDQCRGLAGSDRAPAPLGRRG